MAFVNVSTTLKSNTHGTNLTSSVCLSTLKKGRKHLSRRVSDKHFMETNCHMNLS